jgi:poly(3-hydroxybutyrate) depolymerase
MHWPCRDCITTVPRSYDPAVPTPLLVSLHGDEGTARTTHSIWKRPAQDKGYILLSPRCPRALGCTKRWTNNWHPDGEAGSVAWVNAQIDALEAAYNIDRSRIYVVGGSRGAIFIGFHSAALASRIAGAALYAGGAASITRTCASCAVPVYVLIGSRDFLLGDAHEARTWFTACGSEVRYDELPKVRHRDIAEALLGGKANEILDWFTARPNACRSP